MAQQAASPASPAPATHGQHADHPWASSALHDASNLLQNEPPGTASKAVRAPLALTHACATPEGSVLRTNARRVAHASAVKDFVAQQGTALQGALTHFSLFERVAALESENAELRSKVRDLTQQLSDAVERRHAAESALADAATASNAASATHPAHHGVLGHGFPLPAGGAPGAAGGQGHAVGPAAALSHTELLSRLAILQQELLQAQQERRRAHDAAVEAKGAVRVLCRLRPPLPAPPGPPAPTGGRAQPSQGAGAQQAAAVVALADGCTVSVSCSGGGGGGAGQAEARFCFSRVLGATSTQQQVFAEVADLVQSSLDGFHVCLMSYGQTGSGKTHTMLGGAQDESRGIVPRALDKIMGQVQRLALQGWAHTVEACCVELHTQHIRDLLPGGGDGGGAISDMNAIKHDPQGVTSVVGVGRHAITSAGQGVELLRRAAAARASHATACNAASSRSHAVFWLSIRGAHGSGADGTRLSGSLCLVDLAGSERLERSQAEGQRKVETSAINSSLSALGDVFEALSSKRAHVPYRNSKLTYLLKPCLSAGGKTAFLVHVAPEPASAHESLTSLRFAANLVAPTELGPAVRRVATLGGPPAPLSTAAAAAPPPQPAVVVAAAAAVPRSSTSKGPAAKVHALRRGGAPAALPTIAAAATQEHLALAPPPAMSTIREEGGGAAVAAAAAAAAAALQHTQGPALGPEAEHDDGDDEDAQGQAGRGADLRAALRLKRQREAAQQQQGGAGGVGAGRAAGGAGGPGAGAGAAPAAKRMRPGGGAWY